MKHKNFFTLTPSLPYFTYPFHIRQSARAGFLAAACSQSQVESIAEGFIKNLQEFLEIPSDYVAVLFNSEQEFLSFIGDIYFHGHSTHLIHGNRGKEYTGRLRFRRYHPTALTWNPNIKPEKNKPLPGNLPVCIFINENNTGSIIHYQIIKKFSFDHPGTFIHIDVTSAVPGILFPWKDLQSFSFRFSTSFGIPGNQLIWFVAPHLFNNLAMIYKGRYPLSTLLKLNENFYSGGNPDLLFLDVSQKVIGDFISRSLKSISNETMYKFTILEQAVQANHVMNFAVKENSNRSPVTIVLDYYGESNDIVLNLERLGVIVDRLNANKNLQKIRITNFPVHSKEQFELLSDIIAGMR